jgi:aspartate/glutamate racemase
LGFAGEIRRVLLKSEERLWAGHKVGYGTVNPLADIGTAIQVFDYELRRPVGVPGTVMTNAGDYTWAVEFDPAELVLKLEGARWADIVQSAGENTAEGADDGADRLIWGVRDPKVIGILTGNPSDAGLALCAAINRHLRALMKENSLGDVSMPRIVILSSPQIGISMEMDKREAPLRKALLDGIDELCVAGAKILCHPAHTTHYFAPDMAARASKKGARFVSMVDATIAKLRAEGVSEIALLGTKYVTDFDGEWSVYRNRFDGIKVHTPSPDGWKKIRELGYEVQQHGPTTRCFNLMRDLLQDEVPRSCKHVVLAMTEFSPVVEKLKLKGRRGKILIDPVDVYGEVIAREYLGLRQLYDVMSPSACAS